MRAITHVKTEIEDRFSGGELDYDDDGRIDTISFIIYGDVGGWGDFFWPHKSYIFWGKEGDNEVWGNLPDTVYIQDKRPYTYQFMLGDSDYYTSSTLCHEFGHVLGAPDLYHYKGNYAPVGECCIMADTKSIMQYPCNYVRCKYWGFIYPSNSEDGEGDLSKIPILGKNESKMLLVTNKTNQENTIFKWSPTGDFDNEYYVVEYRKGRSGEYYDNSEYIDDEGVILVFRINPAGIDENGFPIEGNGGSDLLTDEIYTFRLDGVKGDPTYNELIKMDEYNDAYPFIKFSTANISSYISKISNPELFLANNSNNDGWLDIITTDESGESKTIRYSDDLEKLVDAGSYDKAFRLRSRVLADAFAKEVMSLTEANTALGEEKDALESDKAALTQTNNALESDKAALTQTNNALESDKAALETTNTDLESEKSKIEKEKKKEKKYLIASAVGNVTLTSILLLK